MAAAAAFLGVPFVEEAAFFFVPAAFLAPAGLADDLVTLPDLVLPSTLGTSTTAGAYYHMLVDINEKDRESKEIERRTEEVALRCLVVLALGLGVLGAAAFLVVAAAFLGFFSSLSALSALSVFVAAFLVAVLAAGLAAFYNGVLV